MSLTNWSVYADTSCRECDGSGEITVSLPVDGSVTPVTVLCSCVPNGFIRRLAQGSHHAGVKP